MDVLDRDTLGRYLDRLGFDHVPAPTNDKLRLLHRSHLERVPFENLDLHAGRRIELDVDRFVSKIVDGHRGGFCYELNGAFAALLHTLGFDVDLLEAHVHDDRGQVRPFDHLCLRVGGSEQYLADVGFGDNFDLPIPFVTGTEYADPNGVFRLGTSDCGSVDLMRGGDAQYRINTTARDLAEFAPGCEFHQSPESHFTKNTVCSRRTPNGRVTLRGLSVIRTHDGSRTEVDIDARELDSTLQHEFGIRLPDEFLARLISAAER
jgi:N-hydroxyarylamine O-acetyltransferase